jgi:hypothetical protein
LNNLWTHIADALNVGLKICCRAKNAGEFGRINTDLGSAILLKKREAIRSRIRLDITRLAKSKSEWRRQKQGDYAEGRGDNPRKRCGKQKRSVIKKLPDRIGPCGLHWDFWVELAANLAAEISIRNGQSCELKLGLV